MEIKGILYGFSAERIFFCMSLCLLSNMQEVQLPWLCLCSGYFYLIIYALFQLAAFSTWCIPHLEGCAQQLKNQALRILCPFLHNSFCRNLSRRCRHLLVEVLWPFNMSTVKYCLPQCNRNSFFFGALGTSSPWS